MMTFFSDDNLDLETCLDGVAQDIDIVCSWDGDVDESAVCGYDYILNTNDIDISVSSSSINFSIIDDRYRFDTSYLYYLRPIYSKS